MERFLTVPAVFLALLLKPPGQSPPYVPEPGERFDRRLVAVKLEPSGQHLDRIVGGWRCCRGRELGTLREECRNEGQGNEDSDECIRSASPHVPRLRGTV